MLHVYAGLNLLDCDARARKDLPEDAIDISKTPAGNLTEVLLTVFNHQPHGKSVYVGFLDPILMLSQQDEARCRRVFRAFNVYMVCSNPFVLPFSWKNGLASLVVVGESKDAETSPPLDNRSSPYVSDKV